MSGFDALFVAFKISVAVGIFAILLFWLFKMKGIHIIEGRVTKGIYVIARKIAIIIRTYGILTKKGKGGLRWR